MIRETLNLKVSEVLTPYILCGFAEKHPLPTFILVFDHKNIILMIKAESDAARGLYSLSHRNTSAHALHPPPISHLTNHPRQAHTHTSPITLLYSCLPIFCTFSPSQPSSAGADTVH